MKDDLLIKLQRDQVLCLAGDLDRELYQITSGKLLVCTTNGTKVTPVAYLTEGDYFGEMSFFDSLVRSAHVISLEESILVKIPQAEMKKQFPRWLIKVARSMTKKLRLLDEVINENGIKKRNTDSINALSIEEQTYFLKLINNYKAK